MSIMKVEYWFILCKKYTSVIYAIDKNSDSDPCKLVLWVRVCLSVSLSVVVTLFEENRRNSTPLGKLQTDAHETTERSIRKLFLHK